MSSGQAQDSGSQATRGHTCPWAAGLEPDSLCLMASGTGLPFLGIKDEKGLQAQDCCTAGCWSVAAYASDSRRGSHSLDGAGTSMWPAPQSGNPES